MAGVFITIFPGLANGASWVDPRILNADTLGDSPLDEPSAQSHQPPRSTTPRAIPRLPDKTRALQRRAAQIAPVVPLPQTPQIDLDAPHWDRTSMRCCLAGPQSETWLDWVHRELDDPRRRTIPVLNPQFLSRLEPGRLAQLIREIIIRTRTMVAPGNEHLLEGDTTAFERVSWMMAPEVVPLLMREASRLRTLNPDGYTILLHNMLNEYFRHENNLQLQMLRIETKLKLNQTTITR
jgi:hypothetical protein